MKNQYFGDRRDFFKYDLVLTFIEKIDSLRTFTFTPMLTENDVTKEGNVTQYDGSRRKDLEAHLRNCLQTSSRDIRNLRSFMSSQDGVDCKPYKDAEYFSHASRKEYFDGIDSSFLHNAVILIDPDTGFEVKNMNQRKRYLRFSDLKQVFDRAENSLVVVHQHIPRKKRLPYFTEIANRIKDWLDVDQCICISDNEIVFFVIATSGLM